MEEFLDMYKARLPNVYSHACYHVRRPLMVIFAELFSALEEVVIA